MRRGLALTLLLLAGCANDPVRHGNSNNKAVHSDLLFEQEGCKIYRFEDSGEPHYYVVCESGNATATTELSYMAGKVVMHRADEIPTVTLIPPQKWRAPEPVASLEEPNAASTTICSQCVSPPTRFRTVAPGQISIEEPSK